MAYPLSSPIDVSDMAPVQISLTNTSGTKVWKVATDVAENLILGTASVDVVKIEPDSISETMGALATAKVKLQQGVNRVATYADPALVASYDIVYPADAPLPGQILINTGPTSSEFISMQPKNRVVVNKDPGYGEFSSIVAALASIPVFPAPNSPTITNQWVVHVYEGTYNEASSITPQSFVYIIGESMEGVTVGQTGVGFSLFTLGNNTGVSFLGIGDTDPNFPAFSCDNCGNFIILHKVTVTGTNTQRFLSCVTTPAATDHSYVFLEYVDTTNATIYTLNCQDTNVLGGFGTVMSIENFFTFEHSNDSIIVDGLNTSLLSHASEMTSDGSGNCIHVKNGGTCNIRGMAITGYTNGILVDNDGSTPNIITEGITYVNNTVNINVLNPLTTGNATGYTEYLKTLVPRLAPFFITGKDQSIITVAQKGADFSTINAALAAITDNSVTNRYVISVGPGIFIETQIVLKPYVTLVGYLNTSTIIKAATSVAGTPFIKGAPYSALNGMTIGCEDYAFPPSYLVEYLGDMSGMHFRCDNVIFDTSLDIMHIGSSNGPCIFLLNEGLINTSAPFRNGFYVEDSGAFNFPVIFSLNRLLWGADGTGVSNVDTLYNFTSFKASAIPNVFGAVTGTVLGTNFYGPAGKGFSITGDVFLLIQNSLFGGLVTGVHVNSSASPTSLTLTSSNIELNTNDVVIDSATAYGTIAVNATISKVTINPSANFGVQITDPSGSIAFGGNLYQGINWNDVTNISEQIQNASTSGIIDGQTALASAGGLNISIGSGTGYVFFGPPATNKLKYVTWAANPSFAIPDNALSWLYVDQAGTINFTPTDPDPIANIILGAVKTYGGSITYIQEAGHVLNNLSSNIDEILRDTWGPVVKSGCLASPGSSLVERAVQVSSGSYSLGVSQYPPVGGDNVSMIGYYGGSVETAPFTNIPLQYDNSGVLTAIPLGKWVKHSVYILSALSGSTQYFFVYGQTLFNTELDAQTGGIPTAPPTFVANMCPVAGVIVTDSDLSLPLPANRFRDIRPTLGFRSEGATASADHNSLLNLTVGNAHPQYFRVDGTSTMAGDINLGANNIFGSGGNLLNGVDLLAHASRHLPGGADALATAAPVNIGSVNAIGIAASFSRSDHVHAGVASLTGTANQISASASLGAITLSTPSTFIAPGTIKDTSGMEYSTTTGISASGATQGTATALTTSYNIVSTTPPGTGVILPTPPAAGLIINIVNRGANTLNVYPNVGGTIDGAAVNAAVTLPSNGTSIYEASTTTQWYTVSPVVTAGSGVSVSYNPGQVVVSSSGVSSFSGDTTGLTPSVPTTGPVVLGGTLVAVNGGTGLSAYTIGDLLFASSSTALARLADIATGNALISGGVGVAPLYGKIGLTTHVVGVLAPPNGGTGFASYTVGDILYANTATSLAALADVATGNVILSGGIGVAPVYGKVGLTTHVVGVLPTTNGGTGLDTSAAANGTLLIGNGGGLTLSTLTAGTGISITNGVGSITISSSGVTSFSAGTTGLTPSSPTTGAVVLSGTLIAANGGTGLSTYTIGDLLYASGSTALAKLADVATGNALISGGISVAPSWGKIGLTTHVSGVLPVANGGTNSSTALNNNRIIVSSGGAIVEAAALTNGQLLIGSTGAAPVAATITPGTGIGIVNGAGSITISNTSVSPLVLSATSTQVSVGSGAATIIGYIPWSDADYGGFTTRTVTAWVIPSANAAKNLTISVLPDGGASIGSLVIPGGSAVGALYTFTITNPGVNTNLQFQVSRTGVGTQNPVINGITLKLA
jgi:pectin methylesterase-like acyl-CoA thioesterase